MGLISSITSKLKGQPAYDLIQTASQQKRVEHHRRLYDYYAFDRDSILQYQQRSMGKTFKTSTIDKMQYPLLNLTKKIVDRLAVAYLVPAERYVVSTSSATDPLSQRDNMVYQKLLNTSNIHSAAKQWNRLAKLHDTVYVGVIYRNGRIEYEVMPPHALDVREKRDNYLEPEEVSFERQFGNETYTVIWTETEHRIIDEKGKMVEGLNPWGGQNLYGKIPYIPCRLKMTDDHWGEGDTELVYMNEQINILLASLDYNAIMQSHGQPVAVNMNFDGTLKTGPDVVIEANDVSKDDVMPEFKFVSPDPAIETNIKLIDWMMKQAAIMKGLSAQSMNTEISDRQSGIAKDIDLAELRERRQDDIEFLRPFEKRLFDVTRTVWNFNETDKMSEKAMFGIDFETPEPPVSPMDEVIIKEKQKALGLWSPYLDYMDEDEGIDETAAIEYVKRIIEVNQQLFPEAGGPKNVYNIGQGKRRVNIVKQADGSYAGQMEEE